MIPSTDIRAIETMPPGSYTFHHNVPVLLNGKKVNMPIDVIIQTPDSAKKRVPAFGRMQIGGRLCKY